MKVYRLCPKKEIEKIFKTHDLSKVGSLGKTYIKDENEIDLNTHTYDKDKVYMHFFPELDNLLYLGMEENMYICHYNIPEEILNENIGYGEYLDYFARTVPRRIVEYCIESKKLDFSYLEKVEQIKRDISIEDYYGDDINDYLETIYQKEETKHI